MTTQHSIQRIHTLLEHNEFAQVLALAQTEIAKEPLDDRFYFFAAFACSQLKRADEALAYQTQAVHLTPNNEHYQFNAAVYAAQSSHPDGELRAMLYYQNTLRLNPNHTDTLWNYGELLRLAGHLEMAVACFEKLLALKHPYPRIYNRLAAAYESLRWEAKTDAMYEILFKEDPQDPVTGWGYATTQLTRENVPVGWAYYNRRFECSWLNNAYHYPFKLPFWDGQWHKGMTLLVHGEQGLGDEMMFASALTDAIQEAQTAQATVIIGCKAPLVRLFQHSFPDVQVFAHSFEKPMDITSLSITTHLPMGHLIARYRHSIDDFIQHQKPYLLADEQRAAYYEQAIIHKGRQAVDGKRRLRVGLMWGTVTNESVSRFVISANRRSIAPTLLAPLASLIDDVEFISLQNHERGAEAALVPQLQMIDFSHDQLDFYDTAALMRNLDVVISVDTSVSHLAGGMDVECWVPLMVRPDWRHGLDSRQHSYWYSKTRYFRQQTVDDWRPIIDQLHAALTERVAQKNRS
ncbi:MAG: hypothetical protein ACRCV6_07700 [Formosimonas sp.]